MKYYKDTERNKYIISFDKEILTNELKQDLKKVALWSPFLKSWVSRAYINSNAIHKFIKVMNKYNFTEVEEKTTLSREEQHKLKIEAKENSINKLEKKIEDLQKEFNNNRGNHGFMFQPNHNTAKGRQFAKYRERTIKNYEKGMELQQYLLDKKEKLEELKNRKFDILKSYYNIEEVANLFNVKYATVQRYGSKYNKCFNWVSIKDSNGRIRKVVKKAEVDNYLKTKNK